MLQSCSRRLALVCLFVFPSIAPAAITASLSASPLAPQPIGSIVGFTAATDSTSENLRYRFRVRESGGEYRTIRDFGLSNFFEWAPTDRAGFWEIETTVRNLDNGESATAVYPYLFRTRIFNDFPDVTRTGHPLVMMYSAPACPAGSRMRVEFHSSEGEAPQVTDERPCNPAYSINIPVAGLRADTEYRFQHILVTGDTETRGPVISAATGGGLPELLTPQVVTGSNLTAKSGFILQTPLFLQKAFATDLSGRVVWYYPGVVSYVTRAGDPGRFLGLITTGGGPQYQVLREFDAIGITTRETNAERVSEQLQDQFKRKISSFHHEAMALPGDRILVLGTVERVIPDVQGPGNVNIVGDMIIVLDRDLNVVWTWDATDAFDLSRLATLGETCDLGSCPPISRPNGNDWLHGTSVTYTPDDNLIYSSAHQDWVAKIDYQRGSGSGAVIWKAGKDADFSIEDTRFWFSHQTDASLSHGNTLLVYDNGVGRRVVDSTANSRGQLFLLDEEQRRARVALDLDLGVYSFVNGSAQRLANGNFQFGSGWLPDDSSLVQEFDPSGQLVYALRTPGPVVRVQRMATMYRVE